MLENNSPALAVTVQTPQRKEQLGCRHTNVFDLKSGYPGRVRELRGAGLAVTLYPGVRARGLAPSREVEDRFRFSNSCSHHYAYNLRVSNLRIHSLKFAKSLSSIENILRCVVSEFRISKLLMLSIPKAATRDRQ